MIWHILKKDWKLMWRMAVGLALIGLVYRIIVSSASPFANGRNSPLLNLSYTFGEIGLLGIGLVVLMVVQTDAIPGLRQDWLVRPIRRMDLLLSKLIFVVLAVQVPIFVIEVAQGLVAGFPLGQSVGAPLQHGLTMLFALELPVLAFAALTRNLTEAVGAAIAVALALALFTTGTIGLMVRETQRVVWVSDALMAAWGVLAAAAILGLQYYRRKTLAARTIGGFALLVWLCLMLVPWPTAFAIEERFSPDMEAARPVQIAFERRRPLASTSVANAPPGIYPGIDVPLRIDGLTDGQILMSERLSARLTTSNGEVVDLGTQHNGTRFLGRWQRIFVPRSVVNRLKDQPVRLEVNYWVTLLKSDAPQPVPALNGNRLIPGVGSCATRVNEEGGWIELRCIAPGNPPCATWFLQNPLTGQQDGEGSGCPADYAPWVDHVDRDSMSRFGGDLHFRDSSGSLPHPVNESQLTDARVMVRVYRPQAHFTRRMVTPEIRLSDFKM